MGRVNMPVWDHEANGNRRLATLPWHVEQHDGRLGLYMGTPERSMSGGELMDQLTEAQRLALITAHEAGHVAIMHGLDHTFGEVQLLADTPEALAGSDTLTRLGASNYTETEARPGLERAAVAMAGWMASEIWLLHRSLNTPMTSWFAQTGAIDDHHWLLHNPAAAPTVYLYGQVPQPRRWSGDIVQVDGVTGSVMRLLEGRWADVAALAAVLRRSGTLTPDDVNARMGTTGWARGRLE